MDRGAYPPGGCVNGREGRGMGQPARFHQGQVLSDQQMAFRDGVMASVVKERAID